MPSIKQPLPTPQETGQVAAMTDSIKRAPTTQPFANTTPTYDETSNVIRTATGIASPGNAVKQKALRQPRANAMRQNPERAMAEAARENAKNAANFQRETLQNRQRAIKAAKNTKMASTGVTAGPSVFGPKVGVAGSPSEYPKDLPFFGFK